MMHRGFRWTIGGLAIICWVVFWGFSHDPSLPHPIAMWYSSWFFLLLAFVCFAPRAFPLANRTVAAVACVGCLYAFGKNIANLFTQTGIFDAHSFLLLPIGLGAGVYAVIGKIPAWSRLDEVFRYDESKKE